MVTAQEAYALSKTYLIRSDSSKKTDRIIRSMADLGQQSTFVMNLTQQDIDELKMNGFKVDKIKDGTYNVDWNVPKE